MGKPTLLATLMLLCFALAGMVRPAARFLPGWPLPPAAGHEALAMEVRVVEDRLGSKAIEWPAWNAAPLAEDTATATPSPTATAAITSTPTPTSTLSTTPTGSPSPAPDTATATPSPTLAVTDTPEPTVTPVSSNTPTALPAVPTPRPTVRVTVLPRGVPSRVPTAVIVVGPPLPAGTALPTVERQGRSGPGIAVTATSTALVGRVPTVEAGDWTNDPTAKRGRAVESGIFDGPVLGWMGAFAGWLVALVGVVALARRAGIRRG